MHYSCMLLYHVLLNIEPNTFANFGCYCLYFSSSLQAIKRGLSQAQQELQAASTDEARAEAQIAVEVHESMDAAVSGK